MSSREFTLSSLIYRLEGLLCPELIHTDVTNGGQSWDAIPFPLPGFLQAETEARRYTTNKMQFLEVGSAMGSKLALMDFLGWKSFGVERVVEYVEVSRKIAPNSPVMCMDALNLTNGEICQFDYIFMYKPIRDEYKMQILVDLIADHAKAGSVMFFPLCPKPTYGKQLEEIKDNFYVKREL